MSTHRHSTGSRGIRPGAPTTWILLSALLLAASAAAALPDLDKNLSPAADWTHVAGLDYSQLGAAVGTVGDLNGDGFSDAAVGAPNMRDPGSARVGAVLVFHGSPTGLAPTPSRIIYGPRYASNYCEFGATLSPAGDVNGDGYGDLLVGSPGYGPDGAAFVYLGSAGGLQEPYAWIGQFDDFTGGSARLGSAVSTAGDVNGDGYDDIIVGTPLAYAGERGKALLFLGGAGGPAVAAAWDRTGSTTGDHLGVSVAGLGDVNADGFDDVALGISAGWNAGQTLRVGQVQIFHGSAGGLSSVPATTLLGGQANSSFGGAVSAAGDMNGDGYADLAVGAPFWDSAWAVDGGRAILYPGGVAGISTSPIWEEFGSLLNDQFGRVLAPAGDVNGDGLADLLVGSPNTSNGGGGRGFAGVVMGEAFASSYMPWYRFDPQQVLFGGAVGTAGDVDGDGFSDILVGSAGYTGSVTLEGRVQLYRGGGDAPSATYAWALPGGVSGSFWGWAVAPAGDVNGDGIDDMLVSAPNSWSSPTSVGLVRLFLGRPLGPAGVADWYAWGPYGNSGFGFDVACAGDVNGDGYDDIIIGAPDDGNEGFAQLWYGGPNGPRLGPPDWATDGFQAGSRFGQSVASAGDVNGDGYADVIIGAPNDDGDDFGGAGPVNEGKAYLYLGSAVGLGSHAWSTRGGQANGNLGNAVAGAGDVNGDGFADVIVGMEAWDQPVGPGLTLLDVGQARIFLGGAAGLATSPATTLLGSGNGSFGHVVDTAGDVNGDGYSDVIVSAVYDDNQGTASVYVGSATGVATTAHWTFTSNQPYSNFGSSVAPAGDVNGDGLSDIVLGAVFGDTGGLIDNGRVWVFAGPLTGSAATTPLREWAGGQSWENIGNVVAGVGDVNGDGFADVGSGAPGYTGTVYQEGRAVIWLGNDRSRAGNTQLRAARQRRSDGSAPVALGGLTTAGNAFLLTAARGSAAGRSEVRLEWQIEPLGTPFAGPVMTGSWSDSQPGGPGAIALLDSPAIDVPGAGPAHWRLRIASRSPYFPHSPWQSPSRNGRQEIDLRRSLVQSGVGDEVATPLRPGRVWATPNPFNPRTRVSFDLPGEGRVRLELYDLAGRRIATLLDEVRPAGRVDVLWDGRDDDGRAVASGLYLVRATGGDRTVTAKVTLLR